MQKTSNTNTYCIASSLIFPLSILSPVGSFYWFVMELIALSGVLQKMPQAKAYVLKQSHADIKQVTVVSILMEYANISSKHIPYKIKYRLFIKFK